MLRSLVIKNYALIEKLDIEFESGFTIITGETGAGKSILLGALSLILGNRADVAVLTDKTKNCVIEGRFDISKYHLEDFFRKNDIDYEAHTIIRRLINPSGKSRAFINDIPVNLTLLKELSQQLIDIHSQHNNLLLNNLGYQTLVIDSFAKQHNLLNEYRQDFKKYKNLQKHIEQLKQDKQKSKEELDYLSFQYEELNAANFSENEQEELENELEILTHAEEISSNLANVYHLLDNEELAIIAQLKEALISLEKIADYYPQAKDYAQRMASMQIDLNDISNEIEQQVEDILFDPARLEFVRTRLDLIYSLQQKHKTNSLADLISLKNNLGEKINKIESFENELADLTTKANKERVNLEVKAQKISKNRAKVIPSLRAKILGHLQQMGMLDSQVEILQKTNCGFTPNGSDEIKFLFSANKHVGSQDITKVASGGEISRVMLSLKSIISESIALPTIIFDEIDTGVSGDIADKMGAIMKKMSGNMQVINITHLPQVAAKGDSHFLVYKESNRKTTLSKIKKLSPEERTREIAKMLSGSEITEAAMRNAKELLKN